MGSESRVGRESNNPARVDWNGFFAVVKKYYPRLRHRGVPRWLALLGTQLLTPYRALSRYPSLHTPDAVRGWNLNNIMRSGTVCLLR